MGTSCSICVALSNGSCSLCVALKWRCKAMGTSCSICVALKWRCKAIGTSCSLCVALSGGVKQWVHLVLCVWH